MRTWTRRLALPVLVLGALSCAPRREALVPLSPSDALARAVRILESFEYNVVERDEERGRVRGIRTAEYMAVGNHIDRTGDEGRLSREEGVWEVTVHVTSAETGSRYRLEARATRGQVDPTQLELILAALDDWRRPLVGPGGLLHRGTIPSDPGKAEGIPALLTL